MGSDVKTDTSDEFKALEMEMQLRHEGTGNGPSQALSRSMADDNRNGTDAQVDDKLRQIAL